MTMTDNPYSLEAKLRELATWIIEPTNHTSVEIRWIYHDRLMQAADKIKELEILTASREATREQQTDAAMALIEKARKLRAERDQAGIKVDEAKKKLNAVLEAMDKKPLPPRRKNYTRLDDKETGR
jgi:hypothetical protein